MTSARRLAAAVVLLAGTAASACLAAAVPAAAAPPAHRGLLLRLVDEPTALRADPRAALYVIDELRPGTTIVRHLEVTDDTGGPTDVQLYPAAATIGPAGFTVGGGAATDELTGWTRMSPSSLHLDQGGKAEVTVTVAVPADATNGERYEGLVAALPPVRQTNGNLLDNRVAVRVYLAVSGGRDPLAPPDFAISALQAQRLADGTPEVAATITNTGGRALDLTGSLRLSGGPGGLSAGPFTTQGASTLGIGATGQVFVKLDRQVPAGPWTARIDATSGTLTRSATATITFPSAAGSKAAPVVAKAVPLTRDRGVVGAVTGGLLALVVLGLLLVLWRRRRRRDDESEPAPSRELQGV